MTIKVAIFFVTMFRTHFGGCEYGVGKGGSTPIMSHAVNEQTVELLVPYYSRNSIASKPLLGLCWI